MDKRDLIYVNGDAHILVRVDGGVATVVESTVPEGVVVEIVDFDNLRLTAKCNEDDWKYLSPEAKAFAKKELLSWGI